MTRRSEAPIRDTAPRGVRGAGQRRELARLYSESYQSTTVEHPKSQDSHPQISPVSRYHILHRKSIQTEFYLDNDSNVTVPEGFYNRPRWQLVSENLGKHAVRTLKPEGAERRIKHIAEISAKVIQFTAGDVTTFISGGRYHVGLVPDQSSFDILNQEIHLAQTELELNEPPVLKSLAVARFYSKTDALGASRELTAFIAANPESTHITLGPLMPQLILDHTK